MYRSVRKSMFNFYYLDFFDLLFASSRRNSELSLLFEGDSIESDPDPPLGGLRLRLPSSLLESVFLVRYSKIDIWKIKQECITQFWWFSSIPCISHIQTLRYLSLSIKRILNLYLSLFFYIWLFYRCQFRILQFIS